MGSDERKMVEEILVISVDRIDGPLDGAISYLEGLRKQYTDGGYTGLNIQYDGWYEENGLYGERPETDKEYERRMKRRVSARKAAATKAAKKNAKELRTYERLHKKYGSIDDEMET